MPASSLEFEIIEKFLGALEREVEGHADFASDEALRRGVDRLLKGSASSDERRAICQVLDQHRDGTRWLAEQIRSRRSAADAHRRGET